MRLSVFTAIRRIVVYLPTSVIVLVGCSSSSRNEGSDPSREWQVTITEMDHVKTVSTIDGSVWEGEARLVEEASIGTAEGDEEYLLIQPNGFSVDRQRRRIAVSDYRVPIVRIYDFDGEHLFDVGREGDGPGEYRYISGVYLNEADGRIFVHKYMQHWINIYDASGTYLDRWEYEMAKGQGSMSFRHGADGFFHIQYLKYLPSEGDFVRSMITFTLDGVAVDTLQIPEFKDETPYVSSRFSSMPVPYFPFNHRTITTDGDLVWGFPTDYSFSVFFESGNELVIKKYWDPVPVLAEEAEWRKASITEGFRNREPSWQWTGPAIPDYKPAYNGLFCDLSNRIWVYSEGPTVRRNEMRAATDEEIRTAEFSSWRNTHKLDVFGQDGKYFGPVIINDEGYKQFSIVYARGDIVLAMVRDEEDVSSIKRLRLAIPY